MSTTTLFENFTARPATLDDVEAVVDLLAACSIELIGNPERGVDEIRTGWQRPGFNLEADTLVMLAPDGQIVGYSGVWDNAPHVCIFVDGSVRPEYRGQGIGTALCQWAEDRARQSIPKAPEGARVALRQEKLSTDEAAQELLRGQGYRLARYELCMLIEMDEPPPEPVVPGEITIRPFVRGQEERAVIQSVRETFKDHWGYVERPFEDDFQDWMHYLDKASDSDPSLWFVAVNCDGGKEEIVGTSLCHPTLAEDPEKSLVFGLGMRRPWRRQGIALALLRHCFGALYRRGKRKVTLGVDAQSLTGATRLYDKAGMRVDRQYVTYEKDLRPGKDLSTQSVED
ncbi:MAG: GNAT family N-acetyltransferase [Chloroflexi bacterium]|nr:GNAT family N-acetyltransferase [Chloroflexota bacterium]